MPNVLEGLNEGQMQLASHIDGPVLSTASAGSGKTTTITKRIMYMLESDAQIDPHSILCLTFTDAGAVSLRQKLLAHMGPTAYQVTISTFHAFCNDVIQNNSSYFGIADLEPVSALEEITFMEKVIDMLPNGHILQRTRGQKYFDVPRLANLFSTMKKEDFSAEYLLEKIDEFISGLDEHPDYIYKRGNKKKGIEKGDPNKRKIDEVKGKVDILKGAIGLFDVYNEIMADNRRYDFNDMIQWVINAFKNNENILRDYQERYLYLISDEAQDSSGSQHTIMNQLMGFWDECNINLIGDENQCQPPETLVTMSDGSLKEIKDIKPKDKIVSYSTDRGTFVNENNGYLDTDYGGKTNLSYVNNISSRMYSGNLIKVKASGRSSKYTPNHICMVKWRESRSGVYVVYIMQKGDDFRIGMTPMLTKGGKNGIKQRANGEKCDKMWILKTFTDRRDAWMYEQVTATNLGIPQKCFFIRSQKGITITQDYMNLYFNSLNKKAIKANVMDLLETCNREYNYPFWEKKAFNYMSTRAIFKLRACNILPEYMQVSHFDNDNCRVYDNSKKAIVLNFKNIDKLSYEKYDGLVYSLDVNEFKTYVADGILTHNCIYGFNGASIQRIRDFISNYDPTIISLNKNYRSTQDVVDKSINVISKSAQLSSDAVGSDLSVQGMNQSSGEIIARRYQSFTHENHFVAEHISALINQGVSPSEIFVIYRKHSDSKRLYDRLYEMGIPVNTKRRINVLNEHIITQILSIMEYVAGESKLLQSDKFFEILHFDFANISRKQIEKLLVMKQESPDLDHLDKRSFKDVNQFIKLLNKLEDLSYNGSVLMFLTEIMYNTGIKDILINQKDIKKALVLRTFYDFVKEENEKNPQLTLSGLLELVRRLRSNNISINMDDVSGDADGVFFTSAHGSKGLEAEHVFMIRCNRTDWEKSKARSNSFFLPETITHSKGDEKEEEARRLFYVAMTRAKTHLYLSCSLRDDKSKDLEPSVFLVDSEVEIEDVPADDLFDQLMSDMEPEKVEFSPKIEKDRIQGILDNFRMSPTSLNSYLRCPLSFYYERILRVPFMPNYPITYGTLFHRVIEESKKRLRSGIFDLDGVIEWGKSLVDTKLALNLTKSERARLKYALQDTYPGFYNSYLFNTPNMSIPEYKIRDVIVNDVPVYGELDDVEIYGNDVVVTDYKTGALASIKQKMKQGEGSIWRQLVFYKILIENHPKKSWSTKTTKIVGIHKEGFEIKYEPTFDDVTIVKEQIKDAYSGIMNMNFDGCGDPECKWCNIVKG